ncbi:hypothetical protein JTB14_024556 [Gonioctena quinquepunctata]|nr:hypothetical protein JTB14_024556 [Gonioctena quinquepunctata]
MKRFSGYGRLWSRSGGDGDGLSGGEADIGGNGAGNGGNGDGLGSDEAGISVNGVRGWVKTTFEHVAPKPKIKISNIYWVT